MCDNISIFSQNIKWPERQVRQKWLGTERVIGGMKEREALIEEEERKVKGRVREDGRKEEVEEIIRRNL